MTIDEFNATIKNDTPPDGISDLLAALWYDAKGDWDQSHRLAQDVSDADGSWVHAYLHRKEGDQGNAGYWYDRAGRPFCKESLQAEWEILVSELLTR